MVESDNNPKIEGFDLAQNWRNCNQEKSEQCRGIFCVAVFVCASVFGLKLIDRKS